eukprot:549018-Prymnesium_polylepis.2
MVLNRPVKSAKQPVGIADSAVYLTLSDTSAFASGQCRYVVLKAVFVVAHAEVNVAQKLKAVALAANITQSLVDDQCLCADLHDGCKTVLAIGMTCAESGMLKSSSGQVEEAFALPCLVVARLSNRERFVKKFERHFVTTMFAVHVAKAFQVGGTAHKSEGELMKLDCEFQVPMTRVCLSQPVQGIGFPATIPLLSADINFSLESFELSLSCILDSICC